MQVQWTRLSQTGKSFVNRNENTFSLVLLCILTFAIHRSALNGFWRFDDGAHLKFAATYAPWQYFVQPAVMLLQSYAHITPYNALFYDINLALFGMAPGWHYAHLLVVLAATSFATYRLMRLWHGRLPAWLAAMLFLAGLPTLHVAQQLMTGHYATGLLFTVLSLHSFTLGVRRNSLGFALLGATLYLFATACKEVYVPLVLVLPAMPVGDFRSRCKAAWPYVAVAVFYVGWRYAVLGQLAGGYIANPVGMDEQLRQLLSIPLLLAGWVAGSGGEAWFSHPHGALVATELVFFAACLVVGIYRKRFSWRLTLVSLVVLLVPLVALARNSAVNEADRYLFLVWWACAVLLAVAVASLRDRGVERVCKVLGAVAMLALALAAQSFEYRRIAPRLAMEDTLYQTVLHASSNTALMPPPDRDNYRTLLTGARHAEALIANRAIGPAKIVVDAASLCAFTQQGNTIVEFDLACNCLKDVTHALDASLSKLQSVENHAEAGIPLSVELQFQDHKLQWQLGPFRDGTYAVLFGSSPTAVPANGGIAWAGKEPLRFRVRHESPDGHVAITPSLQFDMTTRSDFRWQGPSIVDTLVCAVDPGAVPAPRAP